MASIPGQGRTPPFVFDLTSSFGIDKEVEEDAGDNGDTGAWAELRKLDNPGIIHDRVYCVRKNEKLACEKFLARNNVREMREIC